MDKKNAATFVSLSDTNVSPFRTGLWRKSTPIFENRIAPCTDLCPCGENIPAWMHLLSEGMIEDAWRECTKENPFPLICGRVCYRFCEAKCNREGIDDKLSINAAERFLGEWAVTHGLRPVFPANGKGSGLSVAIVGGGPAGLSAAYRLRREGASVTIYDEREHLGGMLRYGIPEYRLPKVLLERELDAMIGGIGIETRLGASVSVDVLKEIVASNDYVLFAHGAHRSRSMVDKNGKALPFIDGLVFLAHAAAKWIKRFTESVRHVSVIGGGNTAIDVARTALRLGAKQVTVIYRRREEDMPAHRDEIAEARKEGVDFLFLALPTEVNRDDGGAVILTCVPVELRAQAEERKVLPVPRTDLPFFFATDLAISAIGEETDWGFLGDGRHGFTDESDVEDGRFLATGDALTGPRSVSEAIASGKKAADAILARYTKQTEGVKDCERVRRDEIKFWYLNPVRKDPRIANGKTLTREEFFAFGETTVTISKEDAIAEAARCINCGTCISCDRCLVFCPDYAILRNDDGSYDINLDMCKGCGLCADVCERGAIRFEKEKRNDNV
ncbi:MAG: hypothetical protein A3D65_01360 [Candidatus Lloydbacteria bacterium RIFCSPHIGHO2_02_FULL_50_13]|uniref:4Fe-4S ferredoxin-type domain-containing protein n=1 Tax=Candidatus Lloydbacteria bacterium RIFCSPHIGHO2_02_FULL_50_13 TaxID=1798661 RepID=A0A1G2D0B1_9BACT|nr:MAG: hypothetical protein A3D65_01360 [Candidatus Lloydbacteria bacterium RIFCSPHIGHO2_02_FULL_50_13]